MRDYLAILRPKPEDAVQHGIKGMHWGIRRTDRQLASDTKTRAAKGEEVTPTAKAKAAASSSSTTATHQTVDGHETSSARYARLAQDAKSGRASQMSEPDLKFFNARTEALAKVNKLNATNPSWLQATSKKVLQQAAQNTMQSIADGVAKKYITTPILENVEKKK